MRVRLLATSVIAVTLIATGVAIAAPSPIDTPQTGHTRYAILFYPASNVYQQLTVQTRPERVPAA